MKEPYETYVRFALGFAVVLALAFVLWLIAAKITNLPPFGLLDLYLHYAKI